MERDTNHFVPVHCGDEDASLLKPVDCFDLPWHQVDAVSFGVSMPLHDPLAGEFSSLMSTLARDPRVCNPTYGLSVRTFAGSSFEGRHEGIKIVAMDQTVDTSVDLRKILRDIVREPIKTLVPPWSWKAAAFAAVVRGAAFFVTNLQAGRGEATKALAVEAVFAFVTGGLIGAISQQLRNAEPLWATAAVVWIALPGLMLLAQSGVHRLAQTPHLSGGLVLSFLVSGVSAAFSWYAMRHGAMLGGSHETTILHDIEVLPKILLNFLLAGPRLVASALRAKDYG